MSRIGIKPLVVDPTVSVELSEGQVKVKGQLGEITVKVPSGIAIKNVGGIINVSRQHEGKSYRQLHGTVRKLIENAVVGVSKGYEKRLDLVGIGYRATVEDNNLTLLVGYTHPVKLEIPSGITAKVEKNTIVLTSHDKISLGEFAAKVRQVRSPEPYKGKGIRYNGEIVRMKAGKAAKTGA